MEAIVPAKAITVYDKSGEQLATFRVFADEGGTRNALGIDGQGRGLIGAEDALELAKWITSNVQAPPEASTKPLPTPTPH